MALETPPRWRPPRSSGRQSGTVPPAACAGLAANAPRRRSHPRAAGDVGSPEFAPRHLQTTAFGWIASYPFTSNIVILLITTGTFLDLALSEKNITDPLELNLGAPTLSAEVTPRRYRLPPDLSRVGRAWLTWTASLCRGTPSSTCKNFDITRRIIVALQLWDTW